MMTGALILGCDRTSDVFEITVFFIKNILANK
jgi:hypothetical protein